MAIVEKMINNYPAVMNHWSETVLQNVADSIIAVDRAWNVVYANPSAERLLRATQSELLGAPLKYCVPHMTSGATAPFSLDQVLAGSKSHTNIKKTWNITDRLGQQHELQCQVFQADRFIDAEHAAVIFLRVPEPPVNRVTQIKSSGRDSLTGLPDRFTFEYEFKKILRRSAQTSQRNHLCFLNISQLQVVNQVCGLSAGDELLKQLAKLIQGYLEKKDLICRFSGNEFLVLCSDCNPEQAKQRMEALVVSLSAYRFAWEKHSYNIAVRIGIVSTDASTRQLLTRLALVLQPNKVGIT